REVPARDADEAGLAVQLAAARGASSFEGKTGRVLPQQLAEGASHERVTGDEGGRIPCALGPGAFALVEQREVGEAVIDPRLTHGDTRGHGTDHVRSPGSLH